MSKKQASDLSTRVIKGQIMNFRPFVFVVISAFSSVLAGCANQPLDKTELAKFVDKPVDVFIKSRFTGTPKTDKPGAAVFTAYYNSTNNRQLYVPATDLGNLCRAQGHVFFHTKKYTGNPLAKTFPSPDMVAIEAYASTLEWTGNVYTAQVASVGAASRQAEINARYEIPDAQAGFAEANSHKLFGLFECRLGDEKSVAWNASVTPLGFLPKDPSNDLTAHKLLILVKGGQGSRS